MIIVMDNLFVTMQLRHVFSTALICLMLSYAGGQHLNHDEAFRSPNMIHNYNKLDYYNNLQYPSYSDRHITRDKHIWPYHHDIYYDKYTHPFADKYHRFQRQDESYNIHPFYKPNVYSRYQSHNNKPEVKHREDESEYITSSNNKEHQPSHVGENGDITTNDIVVVNSNYVETAHSANQETKKDIRKGENLDSNSSDNSGKFKRMEKQGYDHVAEYSFHNAQHQYIDNKMCKFMHKYVYQMDNSMIKMACDMYMNWGYNMHDSIQWKPTSHQKSWFEGLGSRYNKHRHKRQAYYESTTPNKAIRKEYRMLNAEERHRFHRAMNILKNTFMDGLSMYDVFVRHHQANVAPGAHFGPAFLPYHRELLLRFENALREIDPTVSIPYWDSNLDHILGDELATHSILWSPELLGNGVGDVVTGPFAYWQLGLPDATSRQRLLFRNLTMPPSFARTRPALMTDNAILHILETQSLRNLTWFVSPMFETNHGAVHNWVGGVMADIPISPTDPAFFMHHAFIDCLWEQMRREQVKRNTTLDPQYDFPNDSESLGVGIRQPDGSILQRVEDSWHYALNPMLPFAPLRNIDGLSNIYFDKFYSCQPSPICSRRNPFCGSKFLFCDLNTERCVPRLEIGASCNGFARSRPCYEGQCCDGVCRRRCSNDISDHFRFDNYYDYNN